jgi:hypothetical protein
VIICICKRRRAKAGDITINQRDMVTMVTQSNVQEYTEPTLINKEII